MPGQEEINSFIKEFTGIKKSITLDSDINNDLGVYGDDLWELIEKYSDEFNVDVSEFLWYFHSGEEGWNGIGGLIFKPPNRRVDYIPITPQMLQEFTEKGFWDLTYPKHAIPNDRKDIVVNRIVGFLALLGMTIFLLWKYFYRSS